MISLHKFLRKFVLLNIKIIFIFLLINLEVIKNEYMKLVKYCFNFGLMIIKVYFTLNIFLYWINFWNNHLSNLLSFHWNEFIGIDCVRI